MKRVNNAVFFVYTKTLSNANTDYSSMIQRSIEYKTENVATGVAMAIATKAYDVYLAKVNDKGVDPRDYLDTRNDVLTIAMEITSVMSDILKLEYKNIIWRVSDVIDLLVPPYEPSGVLFYNKIVDNAKNKLNTSMETEIMYSRTIAFLACVDFEKTRYNTDTMAVEIIDANTPNT